MLKFCQKHWDMLRAGIETRGLTHLVSDGDEEGHEAVEQLLTELDDGPTAKRFDPLLVAAMMIVQQAADLGGDYLLRDDTPYCPICEAMKHTAKFPVPNSDSDAPAGEAWVEKHWTDGPLDASLEECRTRGLAPPQQ